MPYLPAKAQNVLFERLQALAAPRSFVAVEALGSDFLDRERLARRRAQMQQYRAALEKLNQSPPRDVEDLWYLEERADVGEWLRAAGWEVSVHTSAELMAHYHRPVPGDIKDAVPSSLFVSGRRP